MPVANQAQFRGLAARVAQAREEERAAVARQLHDELGQELTALKYELVHTSAQLVDAGLPRHLVDRLQSLIGVVELTTSAVRRIAQDLRPPALDLDLSAAIEFEAAAISKRTGLRCRVSSLRQNSRLTQTQSIAAFRVFQEAITNVVRHANASAVRIKLTEARGRFTMEIHDNGRGITGPEIKSPSSIGLLGMHEAIEPYGGTLSITGRRGHGTAVIVRLPLPAAQARRKMRVVRRPS